MRIMQTQIKSQISASITKRFVIVLLEEFAIYSFGSLLDALRIANALSGKTLYNWIILAENGGVIRSSARTEFKVDFGLIELQRDDTVCLLYTSPSPRDKRQSRMPSSA